MINERRAILVLIDAGRITVLEAERLIAAWEDAREWFWIAVACAAVCLLQSDPHITLEGLASLLHTFVDHATKLPHHAASFGLNKVGGMV
jgi:hypothetical protein